MDSLPHFLCGSCQAWNGLDKPRSQCRNCGAPAPTMGTAGVPELMAALRVVTAYHDDMVETLARTTERCSGMLDVARAAKRLVDVLESAPEMRPNVAIDSGSVEALAIILAPYIEDIRKEVGTLRTLEGYVPSKKSLE